MKRVLTTLWRGMVSFFTTDTIVMLIAYIGILFCLTFGLNIIWTFWTLFFS